MTHDINIPHGYKATALGIIPQEWEVKRIKDFGPVITGNTPSTLDSENYGGYYMFVSPADLSEDAKYIITTEKTLSDKGFSQARKIPKGSILFTCIGSTIGKIGIASQDLATNQQINSVVTNGEYLFYALSFQSNKIRILANEQAVPIINKSDFERIKVAFPPLAEQRKIAEVLGVWDEAIEKQARLIEKLALRKRALMQRLLSAKLRLPGFSEPWKEHKIADLFSPINDTNDGREHIPMTISAKSGFISQKDKFDRVIAGDSLQKYILLKKGDFAYNKGNSNLYEMGCIYHLNEESALVPFVYICFRSKGSVNIDFYSQFFINHGLDRQLKKIITSGARGDGLLNVDKKDFFALNVPYPTIEEQTAIAEVLTAADREIELAKEKLDRLRRQKRGLMQQLLTGKKRIKY